jgi:molecular chaperone DnaJ
VKYKLPAGTQSGTQFRLRGQGAPMLRGNGKGDQWVTVQVDVPTSLTAEQRKALEDFDALMNGKPPKELKKKKKFFDL